jgi:hypothetical protein
MGCMCRMITLKVVLFVDLLFNDALSSWDYITSNGRIINERRIGNNTEVRTLELEYLSQYTDYLGSEVFTAVTMKDTVFWDMAP